MKKILITLLFFLLSGSAHAGIWTSCIYLGGASTIGVGALSASKENKDIQASSTALAASFGFGCLGGMLFSAIGEDDATQDLKFKLNTYVYDAQATVELRQDELGIEQGTFDPNSPARVITSPKKIIDQGGIVTESRESILVPRN